MPDKPEALIKYEQTAALGIPMIAGGLLDQPHIWMMEYGICKNKTEQFQQELEAYRNRPRPKQG